MNTTISFSVSLPCDSLFCPQMMCTVYDNIFSGFSQPIIGVFTLPIGKLMDELYEEQHREKQRIEEILESIAKVVETA